MQPIRETLRRYTYDARSAASQKSNDDYAPSLQASPSAMASFKSSLRRIPILAPAIIGAYRLIKIPSRIALLLLRVENVVELLTSVSMQHKLIASRVEALESIVAEASRDIQVLRARSDRTDAHQGQIFKTRSDSCLTSDDAP